jgi:hypothetical protein
MDLNLTLTGEGGIGRSHSRDGWPLAMEGNMNAIRNITFASAVTCAFVTPSFAQNFSLELSDRQALMIDAAGKVSKMTVTDAGHKMMMKYGHPVKAGTIFYMAGGTLYMATNRPMSGGRAMLVDAIH